MNVLRLFVYQNPFPDGVQRNSGIQPISLFCMQKIEDWFPAYAGMK